MKMPFSTIGEAAQALGCRPKTIQRAISQGTLRWQGTLPRVRGARGIDLAEAGAALYGQQQDGVKLNRESPVVAKVERFIRGIRKSPGKGKHYSPQEVMGVYLAAAHGGADIDFLSYCIQKLREEDEIFVRMAMGEKIKDAGDNLRRYAAKKLAGYKMPVVLKRLTNVPFINLWTKLVAACRQADVALEPVILFNETTDKASLQLAPRWLSLAPHGLLPEVGGVVSAVKAPRLERSQLVCSAALKISKEIHAALHRRGAIKRAAKTYETLLLSAGDKDNQVIWVGKLMARHAKQLAEERRNRKATLAMLYDEFNLTRAEGDAFMRAVGRMSPDVLDKKKKLYNDKLDYTGRGKTAGGDEEDIDGNAREDEVGQNKDGDARGAPDGDEVVGWKIRFSTLANVFGVTRQTATKWIKAGWSAGPTSRGRNRT